jgi:hypothetical protein
LPGNPFIHSISLRIDKTGRAALWNFRKRLLGSPAESQKAGRINPGKIPVHLEDARIYSCELPGYSKEIRRNERIQATRNQLAALAGLSV